MQIVQEEMPQRMLSTLTGCLKTETFGQSHLENNVQQRIETWRHTIKSPKWNSAAEHQIGFEILHQRQYKIRRNGTDNQTCSMILILGNALLTTMLRWILNNFVSSNVKQEKSQWRKLDKYIVVYSYSISSKMRENNRLFLVSITPVAQISTNN